MGSLVELLSLDNKKEILLFKVRMLLADMLGQESCKCEPIHTLLRLSYISTICSHLQTYSCPNNINYLWNMGFLLFLTIVFQIVSGILLALYYVSDINYSSYSVMYIIREVYYGWCLRYIHSSGASFTFGVMYFHIGRGLYVNSSIYNTNLWLSGIVLFIFLMVIAFLGYVLTWGQMSFWGGTVITNLFSSVP